MKSSTLRPISPLSVVPRVRLSKSLAALFAAALAIGLGAQSVLAQGPYYPQVNPNGGAPFEPNGYPVISTPELNLIENKLGVLYPIETLIIPFPTGKTILAPVDHYRKAVQAAATAVAAGPVQGVTVASLALEVAKYRQGAPSQVADGLQGIADGVIASGVAIGTKQTLLEDLVRNAAQVNPAGAAGGLILARVFTAAAGDNTLVTGLGALVNNALAGASSGTPPPVALSSSGIGALVYNAVTAISNAPTGNAATMDNTAKGNVMKAMATSIMNGSTIAGSPANIDQVSAALVAAAVQPYASANSMIGAIRASGLPATEVNLGAIAQGALRGNPAAVAGIQSALLDSAYVVELTEAFKTITPANAGAMASTATDPAAIAAAGVTKYGNSAAAAIVRDVLQNNNSGSNTKIVARGVAAAIGVPAQNIASLAVNAGTATVGEVATGAITGAPIGSAGDIAAAVIIAGGLTNGNAMSVGDASIRAAAAVSTANVTDAYADIAFKLSYAVKGANVTVGTDAVKAEVLAILASSVLTQPTYIAVVAAAVGAPANRAAILSAGTGPASGGTGTGGGLVNDAAANAGAGLLGSFTNVPLANYKAILDAIAAGGATDARNLALLYAASLGNSSDAAASLAALIANTTTSTTALTAAAVSANRSKQTGLTIAASVALFAKNNPNADIQATIGHQILDNPSYVKEISSAATVVIPQFSHVIAHAVAFNQPKTAYDSVAGIFLHSQITIAGKLALGDRPAAAAAITAALTTGIIESKFLVGSNERKLALQGVVSQAVIALVNPLYNKTGPANFLRHNGVTPGVGGATLTTAKGVAGGITGFVAQMVNPGVNAIDSDTLNALFQASYTAALLTGSTYTLDIAQAAGQAFGWVTGVATSGIGSVVANQIATAVFNGNNGNAGGLLLANIRNAVDFGIDQAAGGTGTPGVGAGGLSNIPGQYYKHSSASGTPVSNIFTL